MRAKGSDRQYDHRVKGQGQINIESVYGVLGEHFTPFDEWCSYLPQWMLMICGLQQNVRLPL